MCLAENWGALNNSVNKNETQFENWSCYKYILENLN